MRRPKKNEAAQHGRKNQLPVVPDGLSGAYIHRSAVHFVFHKAFTAQAWSGLERESDLVRAGYEQTGDPAQLSAFVTDDLRVTLISQDGSVLFESATDQPMEII